MAFVFRLSKLAKRLARLKGLGLALALGACATDQDPVAPAADLPAVSLAVTPPADSGPVGRQIQFIATASDAAGHVVRGGVIRWVSDDSSVAGVDSTGRVTYRAAGRTIISASSAGTTADVPITVTPVPVRGVKVTPYDPSMGVGSTARLTTTLVDSAGNVLSGRVIVWASSAPNVAQVDSTGRVSAVAVGSANITATSEAHTGAVKLSVVSIRVATVQVTPRVDTIPLGGSLRLQATARDGDGHLLNGRVMEWTSLDSTIVGVTSSGMTSGQAPGTAAVIVSTEGKSDTATVTVITARVASVAVSPATATLGAGKGLQLHATPMDSAGDSLSGRAIVWSSSDASVATVSGGGYVQGISAGTATILATSEGQMGSAVMTVTGSVGVLRYVDPKGDDANPGTSAAPFRTPQRAAEVVNPGDIVIVRDGVYTGGTPILDIRRSGTASAWIVFQAEHRGGAVLDGRLNSSATGVDIRAAYIRVEGFEVRGTGHYGIDVYQGHDVVVAQNHVHDIGRYCTNTSTGMVGINAYAPNLVIEQNVVHDVGRYADGENGCHPSNLYWQNHDHGIYHGVGNNVVIQNNVFYHLSHGWAIHRYDAGATAADRLTIVHNTFVGPNPYKVGQIIIATVTTNVFIANNIFYQPNTAAISVTASGVSGSAAHNLVSSGDVTYGGDLDVSGNLLSVDPGFLSVAGLDFRLTAGSAALNAGESLPGVRNDFAGNLRPRGSGFDIGAYEFQ